VSGGTLHCDEPLVVRSERRIPVVQMDNESDDSGCKRRTIADAPSRLVVQTTYHASRPMCQMAGGLLRGREQSVSLVSSQPS